MRAPLSALFWLQALTDALCILGGFAAAAVLVPYPSPWVLIPGVIFGAAFLGRAGMKQLYEWPTLQLDLLLVERLIRASLWALLAAGLGVVALRAPGPSRAALFGGWALATGLVLAKRWAIGVWRWPRAIGEVRILLVAPPATARRTEEHFARIPFVRFRHLPLGEEWAPAMDSLDDLKRVECDEIWVPASVAVRAPALLSLEGPPRPVRLLWDLWGVWGVRVESGVVNWWPLAGLHGGAGTLERLVKRLFDLAFAGVLVVLTVPVFLGVAAAIKLTSPGPVFFRHMRMGRDGGEFRILKFRSMYASAEAYKDKPVDRGDLRVTPVGKFLRQTGIDELPQIFNVLRGEMSFVGPRPEMPYKVAEYTPHERVRLQALPGITGLWQVNVHRSRAIHDALEYDLYYLSHRSLLLDLLIIGATVVEIVKGVWGRSIFGS